MDDGFNGKVQETTVACWGAGAKSLAVRSKEPPEGPVDLTRGLKTDGGSGVQRAESP